MDDIILHIAVLAIAVWILFRIWQLFTKNKPEKPECKSCELKGSCSKKPGEKTAKGYIYKK